MKIVVTGGSGFIGSALLPRLVKAGHEVVLLSRNPSAAQSKLGSGVKVEQWDGKTTGPWASHVDGANAIINFAGEPLDAKRWSPSQKERIIGSRVNATSALVDAMERALKKPSVLINASGVGYYGPVDAEEVTEHSSRGGDFLSDVTFQWEHEALRAKSLGVRTVILRIAVVLGGDGGALRTLLIPFNMFIGGSLGSGRQWFSWIHRDDLIEVIVDALTNPKMFGPVNAVAPESVTMKEFCATLGRVLHRPSWAPVPSFIVRALLGEMSGMVLTGQRAVPKALEQYGFKFKFPELELAIKNIVK